VLLLDSRDGTVLRRLTVGADPYALAVNPRTGLIAMADQAEDIVRLLDGRSGTVRAWTRLGGIPWALTVDGESERILVAWGSAVSVLDTRAGRVRSTTAMGPMPRMLIADGRTGRAFVVDQADDTVRVLDARTGQAVAIAKLGGQPPRRSRSTRRGAGCTWPISTAT